MIFYCGSTADGTLRRRVIVRYAVMEGEFCTEFAMNRTERSGSCSERDRGRP